MRGGTIWGQVRWAVAGLRGVVQFGLGHAAWNRGINGSNPFTPTMVVVAQLVERRTVNPDARVRSLSATPRRA